ncbi:MAG TPA: GNAT family N-acetyltransferase [Thermoanaerobaculia bacterium]|nr:GNAT family N-acetyltransferase [Thermoanaerobaculia bacterium]
MFLEPQVKVDVLPAAGLTPELTQRWAALQAADSRYSSPYLAPEFTATVAQVRDEVQVGLLSCDGEVAGFFPFQRHAGDEGGPVGDNLCDFQAIVAAPGVRWTAADLLRGCGLRTWRFQYLLDGAEAFRPHYERTFLFTYMDLSRGYQEYVRERRETGSQLIKDTGRRRRRLEREIGPLRFEPVVTDAAVLRQLMRWKSAQYLRTDKPDRFAVPWIVELLERLHGLRTESFAGILSALWAGDALVAAHLGMRWRHVWHWWFPTYDRKYARYSPGVVLDLLMAESAPALGIQRIDLGRICDHKQRLMSGAFELAQGCARV